MRRPLQATALASMMLLLEAGPPGSLPGQDEGPPLDDPVPQARADTGVAFALSRTFREAAQAALPAVVFVTVEAQPRMAGTPVPEPFREFFGAPGEPAQPPPQRGTGSGFIISSDGEIVTNAHVVATATRIQVRLPDGREYAARVIGADLATDVALLQIENAGDDPLPTVAFGSSDDVRVGDWVLALGNPLGLDFTVTAGIVSAKGRQLTGRPNVLESFIQTDAPINPGNSGGPLIDLYGRVVGINAAIAGATRFVGYGFAIPSALAQRVIADLREYGYVRRPRLGITVADVRAEDAEAFELERVTGAFVRTVEEGSPADRAGLQIGDVIVELDREPIPDATRLTTALAAMEPGDEVTLTVIRDGREREVTVELGRFPRPEEMRAEVYEQRGASLGLAVEPLGARHARRFDYGGRSGLVITDVAPYSPAARAGVRPNQLIVAANDRPIRTVEDLREVAQATEAGEVVSLRVVDPQLGETVINFRAE